MDDHAPGLKLIHPDGTYIQRVIDAFVDDVNSGLTKEGFLEFEPNHPHILKKGSTVYEQTKLNMQLYSHLLFTTGGRLALHKCAITMLVTKWLQGRRRLEKTHLQYPPILIQPGINQPEQEVQIADVQKARRMLGVYVSPAGGSKEQFDILRAKSSQWASRVKVQHLNGQETFMAFTQGIMKSLEFPTGASYLTEDQCTKIQSPALIAFLQRNGIASTMSRNLVFASHRYGCLGIKNLYTDMGIQKITMLLGHMRKGDKTGTILRVALGCLQQEVGLNTPVLESSYATYACLTTHSWMRQLWKFISELGGSIRAVSMWIPSPTFENDINISKVIASWDVSDEIKYKINICRLYKRCYFIGDLLDSTGTRFLPHSMTLQQRGFHSDKFPRVVVPSSFEPIWQFAIRQIIFHHNIGSPLGRHVSSLAKEWGMDSSKSFLIRQVYGTGVVLYAKIGSDVFSHIPTSLKVPIQIEFLVKVRQNHENIIVLDHKRIHHKQQHSIDHHMNDIFPALHKGTFLEYINSLPATYRRNLGHIEYIWRSRRLASYLEKGKVIGVGDASVDKKKSSHAYVLESRDETISIRGAAPVDNDVDDVSSNRAEGCTVLAIITMATALSIYYELNSPSITVFCDNDEALRYRNYKKSTYSKLVMRDIDIKLEVSNFLQNSPLQIRFETVQGHADDSESFVYEDAPQEVRRNIDMDKHAKLFLKHSPAHFTPNRRPTMFFAQKIALFLQGTLITGDITRQISLHKYGHTLEERIQKSLKISSAQLEQIEWEGLEIAFRKLSGSEKISRMKVMHKCLPTRLVLSSRDDSPSPVCVRCDTQNETFIHIFQCKCRQNKANHRQCVAKLRQNLRKALTHPLIVNAIDLLITGFHEGRPRPYARPLLGDATKIRAVEQVYRQQQSLGGEALARGFISRNWMVVQNLCDHERDKEHKNVGWIRKFIKSIWAYSYEMWGLRCKQTYASSKENEENLNHQELLFSIRQFFRRKRSDLSFQEKRLHLNLARGLKVAHVKTLARWLRLLKKERQFTMQQRRTSRKKSGKMQTITKFMTPKKRA